MMKAAPSETFNVQVEFGLHSSHPYSWGWELNGDDHIRHWGVEDTQLAAYLAALGKLEDVSAMLGNPLQEPAEIQENTSISMSVGLGIIASYPDKWAWEVSSDYNGYGWGTASSLQAATREAQEYFQNLQSEIALTEIARLKSAKR